MMRHLPQVFIDNMKSLLHAFAYKSGGRLCSYTKIRWYATGVHIKNL